MQAEYCHFRVAETLFPDSGGWVTNKRNQCVRQAMEYGLQYLKSNGTLDAIHREHFREAACALEPGVIGASARRLTSTAEAERNDGALHGVTDGAIWLGNAAIMGRLLGAAGAAGGAVAGGAASELAQQTMKLEDFAGVLCVWAVATVAMLVVACTRIAESSAETRARTRTSTSSTETETETETVTETETKMAGGDDSADGVAPTKRLGIVKVVGKLLSIRRARAPGVRLEVLRNKVAAMRGAATPNKEGTDANIAHQSSGHEQRRFRGECNTWRMKPGAGQRAMRTIPHAHDDEHSMAHDTVARMEALVSRMEKASNANGAAAGGMQEITQDTRQAVAPGASRKVLAFETKNMPAMRVNGDAVPLETVGVPEVLTPLDAPTFDEKRRRRVRKIRMRSDGCVEKGSELRGEH